MFVVFVTASLLVRFDDILFILFELEDLSIKLLALLLEVRDLFLLEVCALLSHECLLHTISNRAFVQVLQRLLIHTHLITDSYKQVASFCTVDGNLADQLVEAL